MRKGDRIAISRNFYNRMAGSLCLNDNGDAALNAVAPNSAGAAIAA